MRIDFPTQAQIPTLRQLWKAAFGDGDDWLDLFFGSAFSPRRCRVAEMDGEIAGALYWLDCEYRGKPLAYLYAIATAEPFRRRGVCRELMADTLELLKQAGYAGALLVPETAALGRMYAGMGFQNATAFDEIPMKAAQAAAAFTEVSPAEYARLRREWLSADSVFQEGTALGLMERLYRFYRGDGFTAAIGRTDGRCGEFLGDISAGPGLLRGLGQEEGHLRTPGKTQAHGMYFPLTEPTPPNYLGFDFG